MSSSTMPDVPSAHNHALPGKERFAAHRGGLATTDERPPRPFSKGGDPEDGTTPNVPLSGGRVAGHRGNPDLLATSPELQTPKMALFPSQGDPRPHSEQQTADKVGRRHECSPTDSLDCGAQPPLHGRWHQRIVSVVDGRTEWFHVSSKKTGLEQTDDKESLPHAARGLLDLRDAAELKGAPGQTRNDLAEQDPGDIEALPHQGGRRQGQACGLLNKAADSPKADKDVRQRVEFGLCGLDNTVPKDRLRALFTPPPNCNVYPVAAFQLAYQGYPWQPTPAYTADAPASARRYDGRVYPAWDEIDAVIDFMPLGTLLSFHLNETPSCPYVSGLLKGDKDVLQLISELCLTYKACHIQINISAHGVPTNLIRPSADEGNTLFEASASEISKLADAYPSTTFLVPVFQKGDFDSSPFVSRVLDISAETRKGQPAGNLAAFYDNSGGCGLQPDSAPEIPETYPKFTGQPIGFTGGIDAENVKLWLSRYSERAQLGGCRCICDAQSGFRQRGNDGRRDRGAAVDIDALNALCQSMYEWGVEDAKKGTVSDLFATWDYMAL